jgi:hypothetical protein
MTRAFSLLACTALLVTCQSSDAPTAPSSLAPAAKSVIIRTRQRVPIIMDRGTHGVGLTSGITYRQVGVQTSKAFFSARIEQVQTFVLTGG